MKNLLKYMKRYRVQAVLGPFFKLTEALFELFVPLVVADIIDCCKHLKTRKYLYWADSTSDNIIPQNESESAMFLKLEAEDTTAALASVEEIFGTVTTLTIDNQKANEIAVVTPVIIMETLEKSVALLEEKGIKVLSKIRIGDL